MSKITVNDCIANAAVMLQISELFGVNYQNYNDFSQPQKAETDLLLSCLNSVCGEVAAEYYSVTASEEISVQSSPFLLSALSKRCIDALQLFDLGGAPVPFRQRNDILICEKGNYNINYTFLPDAYSLCTNTDFNEGRLSARILAYGVCAEYCLVCGLLKEQMFWDKRYKDALLGVSVKKNLSVLPRDFN